MKLYKKYLTIAAVFTLSAAVAPALDVPIIAGFGPVIDFNMTSYNAVRAYETGLQGSTTYSIFSGGALVFFDVKYIEVSLGFTGLLNYVKGNETLKYVTGSDWYDAKLSGAAINLSLSGKYPFEFSGFQVYPLLGIEGRICVSMRYREDSVWDEKKRGDSYQGNASDWSSFWFRLGGGADFYLNDSLFIRTELTFGIKLNTARENAILKLISASPLYKESSSFGAGGKLVVALGYNFGETSIGQYGGGGSSGRQQGNKRTPPASRDNDIYMPYPY